MIEGFGIAPCIKITYLKSYFIKCKVGLLAVKSFFLVGFDRIKWIQNECASVIFKNFIGCGAIKKRRLKYFRIFGQQFYFKFKISLKF